MRWADRLACAAAAFVATALPAAADLVSADFVSDPAMCGRPAIETQEMGMRLDATGMWAIEYTCEWQEPVDFDSTEVQVRPGYCSEPGLLFPTVFAFVRDGTSLLVFEGPGGEPATFTACD